MNILFCTFIISIWYLYNNYHNTILLIIEETVKDSSSEREESDSEKSEINESLSVQSESKFSETNITKRRTQQKSAILNNDYNSDEIYIPKMKKRRSSKFIFIFTLYRYFI